MKNGLIRKIGRRIALTIGGAGLLASVGCTSLNFNIQEYLKNEADRAKAMEEYQQYEAKRAKIMKELGIENDLLLDNELRNDYSATIYGGMDLRTTAGIATGTIKVEKTENGYKGKGYFSQFEQQAALDKICEIADINTDMIVTDKEARTALLKAYRIATGGK